MARYVVLGASSGVGREIVRLLAERPASEVARICTVGTTSLAEDSRIVAAEADLRQPHTLRQPLAGARVVFCAAGCDEDDDGASASASSGGGCQQQHVPMEALVRLAAEAGVRRLVLVSRQVQQEELVTAQQARQATPWQRQGQRQRRSAAAGQRSDAVAAVGQREQRLRNSCRAAALLGAGLEYSILRLGPLVARHAGQPSVGRRAPMRCVQRLDGDPAVLSEAPMALADAAAACLAAVRATRTRNTTFDLIGEEPLPVEAEDAPAPSASLFAKLSERWDEEIYPTPAWYGADDQDDDEQTAGAATLGKGYAMCSAALKALAPQRFKGGAFACFRKAAGAR